MPTNVMSEVIPMLGYIDQLRSNRTGIGKGTMGLDADELQNVTKGGQLAAMSAAALIVELIARMLAEGVKGIFQKIRSELIRNQDKPMWFKIRGKWTEVDPASWRRERRVLPNVGLGSGNREEMRANVDLLTRSMAALAPFNMVGPKQVYNAFKKMAEALGFTDPESFAMDPSSDEYKQHLAQMQKQAAMAPQAPQVQAAKIRAETELVKDKAANEREQGRLQSEVMEGRIQLIHEALQNKEQQIHEGVQGHKDRELNLDSNHLQIILKLIPAIAQVLAAEKRDAGELGPDVEGAAGAIQ
jgi:hypothetical protein